MKKHGAFTMITDSKGETRPIATCYPLVKWCGKPCISLELFGADQVAFDVFHCQSRRRPAATMHQVTKWQPQRPRNPQHP